jgi:hypothetical protein
MTDDEKPYGFGYSAGLNLEDVEATTREEVSAFLAGNLVRRKGRLAYPVTAYSFLLENRPDMLKQHMRQMQFLHAVPDNGELDMSITVLTMLHWYACNRVVEGIAHEVRSAAGLGASKAAVNEILALAFMHSGPSGFGAVHDAAHDFMNAFPEPSTTIVWPQGWAPDNEALRTGLDFSVPDLSAHERDLLFEWYETTLGCVPRSIQLLVKYNPRFAKAHRAKFETALKTGALPKQVVPYILVHYNMNRGWADGIREAALLGKAWGMTRDQVVHAMTLGTGYMAGLDGLAIADEAIGDLLESWDD